jgi:hypothetical protein
VAFLATHAAAALVPSMPRLDERSSPSESSMWGDHNPMILWDPIRETADERGWKFVFTEFLDLLILFATAGILLIVLAELARL